MNTRPTQAYTDDTICAISTPHGVGGIAVIRLSGPKALEIAQKVWKGKPLTSAATHTAHLGTIINPENGEALDQAVATIFRAPGSYTGDDTIEFSVHGSTWIQSELLHLLNTAGARMAQPGEFTRRAFLTGHLDLTQAEAVADLIAAKSRASQRLAMNQMRGRFSKRLTILRNQLLELASLLELELDFSEEDVEFADRHRLISTSREILDEVTKLQSSFHAGQAIKQGIAVAIVGPTNVGKSSLLNALLGDDRAIVSDIHGTTRDTVEDMLTIGDHTFRLIDTAGLRHTSDTIEQKGIDRSLDAARRADIIIALTDLSRPETALQTASQIPFDTSGTITICVANKADIAQPTRQEQSPATSTEPIIISAMTGQGLSELLDRLSSEARRIENQGGNNILITNARHAEALAAATAPLQRVIDGLTTGLPGDLIAQDLREALHHLGTILGDVTTPDILASIFSRFCVGK